MDSFLHVVGISPETTSINVDIRPPVDPREWKRQRDRDRYAKMPTQQKEQLLKKRRDNYKQNKSSSADIGVENHRLLGTMHCCMLIFF